MAYKLTTDIKNAMESFEICELEGIIQRQKPADFEMLQTMLVADSVNPEYRQRAIYALGRWKDHRAATGIIAVLPKLNEQQRITALEALGRLGGKKALNAITTYIQDPSPQVRKIIVDALSRISTTQAKFQLREIAEKDELEWIRKLAITKLNKR